MTKCYEIICDVGVIGVTSDDDDALLHCAREDDVQAFGRITKAQFDGYGDKPWNKPISRTRWKPIVRVVLELERIKT